MTSEDIICSSIGVNFSCMRSDFHFKDIWQKGDVAVQICNVILPETNSSPLKIGLPNRKVVFQPSILRILRGYVSFREGNPPKGTSLTLSRLKFCTPRPVNQKELNWCFFRNDVFAQPATSRKFAYLVWVFWDVRRVPPPITPKAFLLEVLDLFCCNKSSNHFRRLDFPGKRVSQRRTFSSLQLFRLQKNYIFR